MGGVAGRGANRFPHFHGSSGQRLADHLPGPDKEVEFEGCWRAKVDTSPHLFVPKSEGKKKNSYSFALEDVATFEWIP